MIVGENNAGKTALLEALGGTWTNKPHVGQQASGSDVSSARLTLRIPKDELLEIARSQNGQLLMPAFQQPGLADRVFHSAVGEHLDVYLNTDAKGPSRTVSFPQGGSDHAPVSNAALEYRITEGDGITAFSVGTERGGVNECISPLVEGFAKRIFFIDSRRVEVHTSTVASHTDRLMPNAQNLAVKIQHQYNEDNLRFREQYLGLVRRVLPLVKFVSPSLLHDSGSVTLKVSHEEQSPDKDAVKLLLSESGTGLGQVLAMLYVIVYESPSAIVIDEPNSYLHPGATRELLRVFQENRQHQYFVSTHSPEVFAEVKPAQYTSLVYSNGQTLALNLSFADLAQTLGQIGISPFYPRCLWVEGETEVRAFPMILGDVHTRFLPLLYADEIDLKRRELNRIIRTYDKITAAVDGEILPTSVKIVVDGEHLGAREREDYEPLPTKIVHFLPRKMFENYLLDSDAVTAVIAAELGREITELSVAQRLEEFIGGESSVAEVNGYEVLSKVFGGYGLEFRKTKHSVELTDWLTNNRAEHFDEMREFLASLFVVDTQP